MSTFAIKASPRTLVGKKVKQLRRDGQVPAVIYGPEFEAMSITLDHKELRHTLAEAGGTQIIEIAVEKQVIPTLARVVQRDYVKKLITHVDFYRVRMDQAIRAEVPLQFHGEAPAARKEGVVTHLLNSLEVEALPGQLPAHLDVSLDSLGAIGSAISAGDIILPAGVRLVTSPEELVIRVEGVGGEEAEDVTSLLEGSAEPEVITARREAEEE
ncbi:MAG: 50S ribosomal protein L25 [Anaerolineae bacterium]|nr:50S ribosomal protein L25 [Anaerolineae bacterium]